ncbi:hypothetical protein [Paenarthrobacter sp. NPDC058040]
MIRREAETSDEELIEALDGRKIEALDGRKIEAVQRGWLGEL